MTIKKSSELYKGKESELKAKFKQDGYNWETVKKQLDSIEISEEIDKNLSKLEKNTDDYYKYLKGLIDKQGNSLETSESKENVASIQENQTKSLQANVTEAVNDVKQSAEQATISAGEKAIMEKAEKLKNIPLIGGMLYDMAGDLVSNVRNDLDEKPENSNFWEKFKRRLKIGFATFVLGIFGIKGVKEQITQSVEQASSQVKDVADSVGETANNVVEEVKEEDTNKLEKSEQINEKKEGNEKMGKINYVGFKLLLELSGEKYNKQNSSIYIADGLKDFTYEEFLEKKSEDDFKNKVIEKGRGENLDLDGQYREVTNAFASKKVQDLLRIGLNGEMLRKILKGVNGDKINNKLKEKFGEDRFNEIYEMSTKEDFDYKKLTIGELSILYLYTAPVLFNGGINYVVSGISELTSAFPELIKEVKEIIGGEEDYFSEDLNKALLKGGRELVGKDIDLETAVSKMEIKEEDKKDFEKVFNFGNKINELVGEQGLKLEPDELKLFNDNLSYKEIYALYLITGGELEIKKMSGLTLVSLIGAVSSIVGQQNDLEHGLKEYGIVRRYLKSFVSEGKDIFTDDQKTVLGIYAEKALEIEANSVKKYIAKWLSILGIGSLEEGTMYGGSAFVIGTGTKTIGKIFLKKGIKKGTISLLGLALKRIGFTLQIGGAAVGLGSLVMNDGDLQFSEDNKETDSKNTGEIDNEKFLKGHKIIKTNIDGKEKDVGLILEDGNSPIIIIDGVTYLMRIIDTSLIAQTTDGLASKDYPEYQPIVMEGNIIKLGNKQRLDINETLNPEGKGLKKSEIPGLKSFWNGLYNWIKDNTGYKIIGDFEVKNYYNLGTINGEPNLAVGLVPFEEQ
ncbi:hypothetical protein BKN14_01495 [Candidatus Gracilibacteria bacterium HOT-871]|nr:hypothetical protein BKN14_01495 [Candidatus Gracilibacteria bacterium HOT-871]